MMTHLFHKAFVLFCATLCAAVGVGETARAAEQGICPEYLARTDLDRETLSNAMLFLLNALHHGDVEAVLRFFGEQESYERQLNAFQQLPVPEKRKKNEEILHAVSESRYWHAFDPEGKFDKDQEAYPQLLRLAYERRVAQYTRRFRNDPQTYLDNIEDIYPLSLLLGKCEQNIVSAKRIDPGSWTAGLTMEISYRVPRGLLSAAPLRTSVGEGTSYCVVATADVPDILANYDREKPLFGELNPATDLGAFKPVAQVTLFCILICNRREDFLSVQVGRGRTVRPHSFGSFCLFKFNFRTPEIGLIEFYD